MIDKESLLQRYNRSGIFGKALGTTLERENFIEVSEYCKNAVTSDNNSIGLSLVKKKDTPPSRFFLAFMLAAKELNNMGETVLVDDLGYMQTRSHKKESFDVHIPEFLFIKDFYIAGLPPPFLSNHSQYELHEIIRDRINQGKAVCTMSDVSIREAYPWWGKSLIETIIEANRIIII